MTVTDEISDNEICAICENSVHQPMQLGEMHEFDVSNGIDAHTSRSVVPIQDAH